MKVEATLAMASRPGRGWRSRGGGRAGADGGGKPTAAQYVPEDKLKEVQRVLYGCNMGQPVPAIPTAETASGDTTLRIWDGLRHETLNEPERDVVIDALADWILERS